MSRGQATIENNVHAPSGMCRCNTPSQNTVELSYLPHVQFQVVAVIQPQDVKPGGIGQGEEDEQK